MLAYIAYMDPIGLEMLFPTSMKNSFPTSTWICWMWDLRVRIGGSYLGVEFVYEALKTDPEAPGPGARSNMICVLQSVVI